MNTLVISIIVTIGLLTTVILVSIYNSPEHLDSKDVIKILNENQTYVPAKVSDLKPNSVHPFIYPPGSPEESSNYWLLIKLPESLGGGKNDESSLRAYNVRDLQSLCVVSYWPNRMQLVDPCHGTMYDVATGIAVEGPGVNLHFTDNALPKLDLKIIDDYVYVDPPTFTVDKNGVIGYGRIPK